jgi:magnesium-transporting ATPase (P-type)
VPEGLPATLSVALAVGVQRMAKVHALIKKLAAVETLGSTNVICTDKTGTLTKAEMTVKAMYVGGHDYEVTGAGYEPVGDFVVGDAALPKDAARRRFEPLLRAMTFANDAKVLSPTGDKGWRVVGDPTEGCLLVAARKVGFDLIEELVERPKIYELPFESVRKRMSVIHVEGDGQKAYVKGAPSETIPRCASIRLDGQVVPLTDEMRTGILAQNDDMSRQALRVLAVAERGLPADLTDYSPDAAGGQRGGRGGARRRHPHHHGDRRLRPHGGGHSAPHRHRSRRPQRARHHRHRPGGHEQRRPQGGARQAAGRDLRQSGARAQDGGRLGAQGDETDRRRDR